MTDVPIREYVEALIGELDKRNEQRFAAQEQAVNTALAAAEKAVGVAEVNAEKWRMNANEWRAAMNDRERQFFTRGMGYVVGALSVASTLLVIYTHFNK